MGTPRDIILYLLLWSSKLRYCSDLLHAILEICFLEGLEAIEEFAECLGTCPSSKSLVWLSLLHKIIDLLFPFVV